MIALPGDMAPIKYPIVQTAAIILLDNQAGNRRGCVLCIKLLRYNVSFLYLLNVRPQSEPAADKFENNQMLRRKRQLVGDGVRTSPDAESSGRGRRRSLRAQSVGAESVGAKAVGTLAVGAVAIGALAIGALAIGRLAIGHMRVRRFEVDELVVRKLHITEELRVPNKSDAEK